MLKNVSVIQGLIAIKGLKSKGFFINLRICVERRREKHYYFEHLLWLSVLKKIL